MTVTIANSAAPVSRFTHLDVDPHTLDVDKNVRGSVDITDDPTFLASIAAHGVLQAVSAVRRADGTLAVHDGQRRTLAAREAGLTSIPVLVHDEIADERAASIERVTAQFVSNECREDLTKGQKAAAVTEMLDLGMSVHQVAAALHVRKDYADKAGRAGRGERARSGLDTRQLSLEGAALLGDLELEAQSQPWLIAEIETILAGYGSEYQLRNLQRRVDERAATTAAAAEHTARGFTLLHDEPSTRTGEWFSLADLRTADGDPVAADAPERAPHLWHVHSRAEAAVWVDTTTRAQVDENDIDFGAQGLGADEIDEAMVHPDTVERVTPWVHTFFLSRDHRVETGLEPSPVMAALTAAGSEGGAESAERAAAAAEADRIESERAERLKVKTLNRAGATATETRRAFLTGLLSGKTAPKNATKWIVTALATHGDVFTESKCGERYADIMGSPLHDAAHKVDGATVARAEVLLLARVLTAFEARLTGAQDAKDYWRFSAKHYRGMVGIDSYLTFLADCGHALTPVEQAAIGNITVDAAYSVEHDL